jgi:PAS domain S-box-containing protein
MTAPNESEWGALMELVATSKADGGLGLARCIAPSLPASVIAHAAGFVFRTDDAEGSRDEAIAIKASGQGESSEHPLSIKQHAELERVFKKPQTLVIDDSKRASELALALGDNAEMGSVALIPIATSDTTLTILYMTRRAGEHFSHDDLSRVKAAANAMRFAFENAHDLSLLRKKAAALIKNRATERTQVDRLLQTKEFLERVIESSVDGIVSADLDGRVLVYNQAAARIFGYSQDEIIDKLPVDRLYPPGVARDIMKRIRSSQGGGTGRLESFRVEMLSKSGQLIPVNLSASLVLDGDQPLGTVGIFTDIRQKLAMESNLAEAQQLLQDRQRQDAIAEIAGAAAHELNQPLTSVMGYAEYLKRAVANDERLSHAVHVILEETQRMADIVRKVGKITRYETKPYVGGARIVDIERASSDSMPENACVSSEESARESSEPPPDRSSG